MSEARRARRYYLLKRLVSLQLNSAVAEAWQAKQEAEPGTLLPVGFPSKAELEAVGYTTVEDVDGADAAELREFVCLSQTKSEAVITAAEALI